MPLEGILQRVRTRLILRDALRAAAAGGGAGVVALLIARLAGTSAAWRGATAGLGFAAAFAAGLVIARRQRSRQGAAAAIERSDPSLRNLVITAEQLLERPSLTRDAMRARVLAEASRRTASIDLSRAIPLSREGAAAALALVALVFTASLRSAPSVESRQPSAPRSPDSRSVPTLAIDLAPPAYSGRPPATLSNPSSVEVLSGTRATLRLGGGAMHVRLNGQDVPAANGRAEAMLTQSGYIAVEGSGINRLVPLTVIPDRAPDVRVTAPAKDLRVPTASASIPITAEAADDLGLGSLEIRYTVVSGTGEQFSFTEGTLPAAVTRASDRAWRLDASLSVAKLKLEPGDALIYRAVAADRRPGEAGIASSDTFFVEVAGPGDVPLEGVEMPPDKERYALSQAMIVLKIERLMAREKTLPRDALAEAAGNIAGEQRAVRANFIFLLGGEIEDEEVEAETSHEITEGRLANQARREIVHATTLMSGVEKALSAVSTRDALPPAREAVKALQRAFGHSRYLLRALPSRARIDPARRLTGDLSGALDWSRALAPPAPDAIAEIARAALLDLVTANAVLGSASSAVSAASPSASSAPSAATPSASSASSAATSASSVSSAASSSSFASSAASPSASSAAASLLGRTAERLLAAGPNPRLQSAARDVIAARDAIAARRIDDARRALAHAAGPLVSEAQRGRIDGAAVARGGARLAGAAAIAPGGGR